jgi:hypothetical protein
VFQAVSFEHFLRVAPVVVSGPGQQGPGFLLQAVFLEEIGQQLGRLGRPHALRLQVPEGQNFFHQGKRGRAAGLHHTGHSLPSGHQGFLQDFGRVAGGEARDPLQEVAQGLNRINVPQILVEFQGSGRQTGLGGFGGAGRDGSYQSEKSEGLRRFSLDPGQVCEPEKGGAALRGLGKEVGEGQPSLVGLLIVPGLLQGQDPFKINVWLQRQGA